VRRQRQQERRQAQRAAREADRKPVPCAQCGGTFLPERLTARFCSVKCRVRAHRAKEHAPLVPGPTEKRKTPWNKGRKWTDKDRARHQANRERMRQEDEAYRERTRTQEAKREREKAEWARQDAERARLHAELDRQRAESDRQWEDLWKKFEAAAELARRSQSLTLRDAVAVLGIAWPADETAIRAAYRRLARQHHPDRGGDAVTFNRMTAARDRLLAELGPQMNQRNSNR
jgi:hypothetical protein